MDTLVLNQDGYPLSLLPLSTIPWTVAIRLLCLDKVTVMKDYEDWIVRSPSTEMRVPSIVMVTDYVRWNRIVKYSRNHVFLRDRYTCQLCHDTPPTRLLTLDHVVPRSKGGKTEWANIVTCCKHCNEHKGNDETIRPNRMPQKPSYYKLVAERQRYPIVVREEEWNMYLQWPEDKIVVHGKKQKKQKDLNEREEAERVGSTTT